MCDPYPGDACPDCGYILPGEHDVDDRYELISDDHWYQVKESPL